MIDNYDSFTYNIVQYLGELGGDVSVYRNDKITLSEIEALAPDKIVISPGPCTPDKAGISMSVVERFGGHIPILGVCLGHQSIAQVFGAEIVRAREVMHGKTSEIFHTGIGVFRDLPSPFVATRYHSLVVEPSSVPDCLEVTAWTQSAGQIDAIMGIRHKSNKIEGVQFHPESIISEYGHQLMKNFLGQEA